jgi:3-phenylpropionate/trans-cinnamate dioxygenase ferredoxin reductase subunit
MSSRVVVIGAGQAGFSVASTLRSLGFDGALTLIGDETTAPYQRPPLSKAFLLGELEAERMLLKPQQFYADQRIEIVTGTTVDEIDSARRIVRAGALRLDYNHAVIATGTTPRRLPPEFGGELAGVYYLRSQADALRMRPDLVGGRRLLVLGGGYIGLEVAAVAAKRGLTVTVVEAAPRILQRVASPATSDYFRALHSAHGVEIREGVGVQELRGDDRVRVAVLSDGTELPVDAVVIGIGVLPNTQLAQAAGLALDNGIAVDATGRTSDPLIWSAGDCCSFPWQGGRIRLESVPHATDHGALIARNIMGAKLDYHARPWFWSDQYDVELRIAGLNSGYDSTVTKLGAEPGQQSIWYYLGDRLLAVDAMNDSRSYMLGRRLLEKGLSPPRDHIADPAYDPRSLL